MLTAATRAPEESALSWFQERARLLNRLGFVALLTFYALAAAYAVTISGRWDEVRRDAIATANETALAAGLGVAKVNITGSVNVTREQVHQALGVRDGVSIFAF